MHARPRANAIALLASHDGDAKALAGGQSLMPMLAFRLAQPALLVDLRKLADLRGIRISDRGVALGAMVRWRDIEDDVRLDHAHPLLKAAIAHVAHYQIRNRGTVGGSIAHADPAAEMPGIAMTCDAEIAVAGKSGARVIQAADFFQGPLTTALTPDEIIVEVRLPPWPARRRWGFQEFARRRGDFAMAAAAVFYDEDANGKARNAHVGAIGVGDRPLRLAGRRRPQRAIGRRCDHRAGRGRRVGRRRSAGRHPRQRGISARADRNHGRARAQARRRPHERSDAHVGAISRQRSRGRGQGRAALTLADCLRHHLRLTGTHVGCEHGVCGACTIIVDGAAVRSCMLAVQAEGAEVVTVEGSPTTPTQPLQKSFRRHHALQCGFCTPGMITTAHALLSEEPIATRRARGALGQSLPLHRLYPDRRGRARRARRLPARERRKRTRSDEDRP